MKKGYVIEFNVRCAITGKKFPDKIILSEKFGETFTDAMKDSKVGDTSIAENFEGCHWIDANNYARVNYDQMFVVTSIE